jgi:hypothetical protein
MGLFPDPDLPPWALDVIIRYEITGRNFIRCYLLRDL